jgi:NAD-dependent dihydropyrimidine dehydrogenase PreA subunit
MPATIDVEKCNGCKSCVEVCPINLIEVPDKHAIVNREDCIDCNACADECPNEAITIGD